MNEDLFYFLIFDNESQKVVADNVNNACYRKKVMLVIQAFNAAVEEEKEQSDLVILTELVEASQ